MSTIPDDGSYALASLEERENRLRMLHRPHIAPLTQFVLDLRKQRGFSNEVPYFDPCDGGIRAHALFLLESPGPKARASGFISRDNPDPSARNFRALLHEANILRENTVLW